MTSGPGRRLGGIEAGGTKFVCAVGSAPVGSAPGDLIAETSFPTTTPGETLGRVIDFLRGASAGRLDAVGVASFGPVDLDRGSPTFGCLTSTPKPGWSGADLAGTVSEALDVPVVLDTDVNGAALAEHRWGSAKDIDDLVYVTVGTGIGGGAIVAGRLVHGLVHPEMGHQSVSRREDDPFEGLCPFHGDCLEGLASGPAMAARWGLAAEEIPDDHPAWDLEAWYLAQGLRNVLCVLSPRRIVLGGGVMHRHGLIERVRDELRSRLRGYPPSPAIDTGIERFVVTPRLGDRAGVLGALALADGAGRASD